MQQDTPRLDAVAADGATTLIFRCTGSTREQRADLAGWIATGGELLAPLKSVLVFQALRVAEHGTAVAWGDDDDLMIDATHLSMLAAEQRPFGPEDAAAWQQAMDLSNQETADFLGIALSTWNSYKAGAAMPIPTAMLCRAARRDPLLLQAHYRPRKAGRPRKTA